VEPHGRSMSDNRRRQQALRFRVSPEEDEKIRAAAKRQHHTVAGFVRHVVMAASDGRPLALPGADLIALRDLTVEIQKIGLVTRKRIVTGEDAERVIDELRRLQRAVLRWRQGENA
jgi:hypothetical protein